MQQTIKTRHGRTLIVPTPEEDAAINAGIAADPDTHEVWMRSSHACGEWVKTHAR